MIRFLTAIGVLIFAVLVSTAAVTFDEIEQTDQQGFRSLKSCSGCHLLQTAPDGVVKMIGAELQGADLRQLNLRAADLRRADLRGVDLRQVNLAGAKLKGALLRGANLQGANLQGAGLAWADLHGVNLDGADLRGADLSRANLTNAALQNADVRGATLCRTVMPSGVVKNPDCQWWKLPENPDVKKSAAEKSAARAPQPPIKQGSKIESGLDVTALLGRLLNLVVTSPDDNEPPSR